MDVVDEVSVSTRNQYLAGLRQLSPSLKGATFQFGTDDPRQLLADHGWTTSRIMHPGDRGANFGRSPPSLACLACRCRCSHSSSRAALDRAPCPWRSACVVPTRTAGALTNPLEHKLECPQGDFRAAAGGRFVDGSLQHRKDNWDVVELHIGANEAGGPGCFEWVGQQSQYPLPRSRR